MEPNVNIDEVRRKADAFLQNLLEHAASRPSREVAHSINDLAFAEGNPVRDLFLTAVPRSKSIIEADRGNQSTNRCNGYIQLIMYSIKPTSVISPSYPEVSSVHKVLETTYTARQQERISGSQGNIAARTSK